jgi:hypothetical protein
MMVNSRPVTVHRLEFFALLLPIGVMAMFAQVFLTHGLARERAAKASIAICTPHLTIPVFPDFP